MHLPEDIKLRPRFQAVLPTPAATVLQHMEEAKGNPFIVKRIDDHIFIKFTPGESHFWSPQLHLEILEETADSCRVYGLFGPNPTLWTFFMFLHFGVATLFIIAGIWAYSSASLGRPYGWLVGVMIAMVVVWFVLYAFGRAGRAKGKPQMHQLYAFYREVTGAGYPD